jgi:hypothetical protein
MHGHITSLAVARSHRKQGIASRLMTATREWRLAGRSALRWLHPLTAAPCCLNCRHRRHQRHHQRPTHPPPYAPHPTPQTARWRGCLAPSTSRCTSASQTAARSTCTRTRSDTGEARDRGRGAGPGEDRGAPSTLSCCSSCSSPAPAQPAPADLPGDPCSPLPLPHPPPLPPIQSNPPAGSRTSSPSTMPTARTRTR